MTAPQQSPEAKGREQKGKRPTLDPRLIVLAAAFLFITATVYAWRQEPRPQPLDPTNSPPAFRSLAWWRYPIERNPEMKLPYVRGYLVYISAPKGTNHIWVADNETLLLHSPDAGRSWERYTLPEIQGPPQKETVVTTASTLQPSTIRTASLAIPLSALFAADEEPKSGQAQFEEAPAGEDATEDQGQDTSQTAAGREPPTQPGQQRIHGIYFLNEAIGWLVTAEHDTNLSYVYHTENGGETWTTIATVPESDISKIQFFDQQIGNVISLAQDTILHTTDGGVNWDTAFEGRGFGDFNDLMVTQSGVLFTFSWEGTVLRSNDQGESWDALSDFAEKEGHIGSFFFLNEQKGWVAWYSGFAVEDKARLYRTDDGGETWNLLPSEPDEKEWTDIYFADDLNGWATTYEGLYRSDDGGATWHLQVDLGEEDLDLAQVAFSTSDLGWAIGQGIILKTIDGGENWFLVTRIKKGEGTYQIFFAPWYFAFLLIGTSVVARTAIRERPGKMQPPPEPDPTVSPEQDPVRGSGTFESDAAIVSKEGDRLNFVPLVERMSLFLRNDATERGLTMAVTGSWGSGKTSFINLLSNDLELHGYRPVYFNAWHHQKEENLLLSLLETIRLEALRTTLTLEGFDFWVRLVWRRLCKSAYWPLVLILLGLFGYSLGHFFLVSGAAEKGWEIVVALRQAFNARLAGNELVMPKDLANTAHGYTLLSALKNEHGAFFLLGLGSFVGLLGFFVKWSQVYSVNPISNLVAMFSKWVRFKGLEGRTASRGHFLEVFGDVTSAMRERRITLLVDDLDRCHPKHVVESLEALNYLSSYGDCYIILCVDWPHLRAALMKGFEDRFRKGTSNAIIGEYADEYMEKLVQIAFSVPERSPEEKEALIESSQSERVKDEEKKIPPWRMYLKSGLQRLTTAPVRGFPWALNLLLIPVCLAAFFVFSFNRVNTEITTFVIERDNQESILETREPTGADSATPDGASEADDQSRSGGIGEETEVRDSEFTGDTSARVAIPNVASRSAGLVSISLSGIAGLILIVAIASLFSVYTVQTEEDSAAFSGILKRWSKLIDVKHPTPRAHKRFKNQARFMAKMIPAVRPDAAKKSGITEFQREHAAIILTALLLHHRDFQEIDGPAGGVRNLRLKDLIHGSTSLSNDMNRDLSANLDAVNEVYNDFKELSSRMYQTAAESPPHPPEGAEPLPNSPESG